MYLRVRWRTQGYIIFRSKCLFVGRFLSGSMEKYFFYQKLFRGAGNLHHIEWVSKNQHSREYVTYLNSHICGGSVILHRLETKYILFVKRF